ncbi:aminodeoxychorismate lyase [Pseudovibrio japonicus]|uniref:Endolytic murein transglycosylase n=1 Tax=Pseudovibrio japonicus TaxID=366534 RepID=A0ABQ3DVP5_9HYPH|nr:endolytic transglycosylase MltG [Pseudovibrio japonicus]GHB17821.1 aminodeoxychorismate lyase [Pseudovibrio japonicus]
MAQTPEDNSNGPQDQPDLPNQSSGPAAPRSPSRAIQPDAAPPPPPRSRHARNPIVITINFLLSMAVLGIIVAGAALYWGKGEFDAAGPLNEDKTFIVASGMSLPQIAAKLEEEGVISNSLVFEAGTRLFKNENRIKAGEYAFPAGIPMKTVMEDLVEGRAVYHSVTFPEGWTSTQIINRLNANEILTGEISAIPAEGSLLPETYTFTRGTTKARIIDQMQKAMKNHIARIWEHRSQGLPIDSPEQLVVLASIVEKETSKVDEHPRVASVFINRLRRGMPLQSDPTILYGLFGGNAWTQDRSAITRSMLNQKNPYNTYQINALPPGPIGNPSVAAMEAVANPARTKDLYFVANGTGGHAFAETYRQHQRNVAEWRKVERELRAKQAAEKAAKEAAEKAAEQEAEQAKN